jgi:hypothetical protein
MTGEEMFAAMTTTRQETTTMSHTVTVDHNQDSTDSAYAAFCECGWASRWVHADEFDPTRTGVTWDGADEDYAAGEAEDIGLDHRLSA